MSGVENRLEMRGAKLITCILPQGKAMPLLRMLRQNWSIVAANVNHARGSGRITPSRFRGIGAQSEKEILSVLVSAEESEQVFESIYRAAEVDRPHGGMMFQSAVDRCSIYALPQDTPEET